MAGIGRPTKYKEEYAHQAYKLCLLGFTDKKLAEYFEVAESTIYEWRLEFPEFSESIKKGKDIADGDVVASLYARAMGYEHPEDDIKAVDGQIVITPTIKRYPPDTASMIFWLKNRQPKLWRDKPEEIGGEGAGIIQKVQIEVVNAKSLSADKEETSGKDED